MRKYSYRIALYLSNHIGVWFFTVFSWFVASGYFLFFPGRVAGSLKFYKALFPERGGLYHLYCVWRQYHGFTDVFLDRFLYSAKDSVEITREGWEHLDCAMAEKKGAIVVMSHIGNWELAARKLSSKGLPIMLYLGEKHKEQIERMQKEEIAGSGVKIVTTSVEDSSPFAVIEGLNFLRQGGIVSLTGDRLWGEQRSVTVRFLGHEVRLPDIPHVFAMMSGAPLFTFFIFRTGPQKYHVTMSRGREVKAATRSDRGHAIRESAQAYADELERMVRRHPFEWYHFEPFLGDRITEKDK
ncbi:MAG: Phosphatidylinositol mannoside acyltransferase [Smithella sp. PtaU1.Bin162]|nr:MAG: Phosphatidylinositol mannoside acyltransferase [Smithella sp. PtaU1.Bin162]